jgi:anti-anti-sigma factor
MLRNTPVFDVELHGATLVVTPTGDQVGFRLARIQDQTDQILESIQRDHIHNVVVDAARSSYLSSSIIGALIQMWEAVSAGGGRLAVCGLTDDAMEALVATRLDTRWPSFPTRAEALAELGGGA